jgi:metal-dependent amidase/aminoacylase/carboxypeptidase family protein
LVEEGVLNNPKVDVIFGLHINAQTEVGKNKYRPKEPWQPRTGLQKIMGKQTHGAYPWLGLTLLLPFTDSTWTSNNCKPKCKHYRISSCY